MIKLHNLTFRYDKVILDKVNLCMDSSKVTFIIGPNGSGKSTLANVISGLLFPQSGRIYLDNMELNKKTSNKVVRGKIGMVFQNPNNQILFPKVYDDIKFTLENMKIPKDKIPNRIRESLKEVGMLDFIEDNPYNLSGGQKQRIAIASQLSLRPDYLIFDEVTSMLDVSARKDIYNLLGRLRKDLGIIYITNNMEELIYADDVVIIDKGKVYKYTLSDIVKESGILTKHNLGIPFIFKIAERLKIKDANDINEKSILRKISSI